MLLQRKTPSSIWIIALLTGLVGLVNLVSAATPGLFSRTEWFREIFPLTVTTGGNLFAALSGFFLLTLASNLLRRKSLAWLLAVILLCISVVSHLIKGLDYPESLLSGILLFQLIWKRNEFTAQSDRFSVAQGVRVLIGAMLFTLAYGTVGFFLLNRQYSVSFNLGEAILQTLAMFFTLDRGGLEPTTPFGRFFANSIYFVGGVTLLYALFMLWRPVLLRGEPATSEERSLAQKLVTQYGCSSLAHFCLLSDKSYYFTPTQQSMIAYVPKGRGAVVLGDPVGKAEERKEVIIGFKKLCRRNDWYPAFYQTAPNNLDLYKSLGFKAVKIGEEAIVDLHAFTLQGKAGRKLRNALNRITKMGHRVEFYTPPIADELLAELRNVSNEWLQMRQGAEKRFSLGWFDENYLRECEMVAVRTPEGEVSAFANIVPEYQLNEITIALMRRRREIEHGTMEFLFISLFQHFKERGYDSFNLGLSPLAGVGQAPDSPRIERALRYLYEHLNRFYNFRGLHEFKEKFQPRWEARYFIYPGAVALLEVVVALIRADSGDRLGDYFKPGA